MLPELPDIAAIDRERVRREPAREFVLHERSLSENLAGEPPTAEEQAAIDAFQKENPLGLAILIIPVRPDSREETPNA